MKTIKNHNTTWGQEADKLNDLFSEIALDGKLDYQTLNYQTPHFIKSSTPTAIEPDFIDQSPSVANVYAKFDRLADAHKPFFRKVGVIGESQLLIESDLLYSTDATQYDINEYELAKTGLSANAPKLIITACIHGEERTSMFALYYFIRDILENGQKSKILTYIKNNCRLLIVPLINPWGYQNDKRENGRNVDLNRNYDINWETYVGAKGSAVFSESESIAIKTLVESNLDAFYLFDFHTRGQELIEGDDRFAGYMAGDAVNNQIFTAGVDVVVNGLYTGIIPNYGFVNVVQAGCNPSLYLWAAFVKLIPASNPEFAQSMNNEAATIHSLENNRQQTHYLALLIQHVFNVFGKLV